MDNSNKRVTPNRWWLFPPAYGQQQPPITALSLLRRDNSKKRGVSGYPDAAEAGR
jgi:hypothetical protein